MSIEQTTREFILKELLYEEQGATLADEENLFARRAVDSIGVLRLVTFLEETYGIQMSDDDMAPENLESVRRIADLVRRKRGDVQG
jgi:acyl carrier protein